ncbi:exodeoxyribonuclease V subunit gamma [Nitrincola alkalilacustris]|uniref:exodeoxyribonuclease V subunit gamma n=1 Tax=Nitrincola alkalilacustris TaxID=1571224 RepID=UPI00197F65FD|nr:exodeoxyribonuclease V subunit gamma [Nitrincola alkalilacustris]
MDSQIENGFMVIQGNRLEALRELAVQWLRRYPLKPLENETILVQSNGIAQWLKLALAEDEDAANGGGCGIAAALNISLPARYIWQAYRAVLGDLPDSSPYDKHLLTWRLLRMLPDLLDDPVFAPLQRFLRDDQDLRKQFQLAQRLADLFDQYQVYRADWLDAWAAGDDSMFTEGGMASSEQVWQAALWRRIIAQMPEDQNDTSRAQVHQRFLSAAKALTPETRPATLPRRVVVFGISSLPQQAVEVLSAVANCSQVLLCVHNPCQHYWGDIVEDRHLFKQAFARHTSKWSGELTDDDLHLHAHPLLASWGKQGRDYIRLLDEHDQRHQYEPLFQGNQLSIDLFEEPSTTSLLAQLQSDILNLRNPTEIKSLGRTPDPQQDRSLSFHITHSAQREVEILQDHLLTAFAAQPDLRPRDVLVMVPDINLYAPHIRAVFAQIDQTDPRFIPFTLSDQGQRQQAPLLIALEMLLNLPRSRFSVSELLDLLEVPAVRETFSIREEDKPLLHRWVEGANIRWGLHARQREQFDLPPGSEQNTWQFGLKRMLLGYAVGQGDAWQAIEPYAEIGGLDAALAGSLVRLLNALEEYWQRLQEQMTPQDWVACLRQLCQRFFSATDSRDELLLTRIELSLQNWLEECEAADFDQPLPLGIVREVLLGQIDQSDLSQRFMAGAVNFATLMPMRAIPFRHICLLGMNESDYPRQVPAVDFDLMRHDYRPGDRSRREDDRYLFMEALLSARDQLYISWIGRSIRDNTERPPSVLVGQLRDYLADIHGKEQLAALTREYPLQPFSRRYFTAGSGFSTYAREWQSIHETRDQDWYADAPLSPYLSEHLSEQQPEQILTLMQLGALLRDPASQFFKERLSVQFDQSDVTGEDQEPFNVDGLSRWQHQDQLLGQLRQAMDKGITLDPAEALSSQVARQQARGELPLPPFGPCIAEQLVAPLAQPLLQYQSLLSLWHKQPPEAVELTTPTLTLHDYLSDIRCNAAGERMRLVLQTSNIHEGKTWKWHNLVRHWPLHLAAQLNGPTHTRILGPNTDLQLPPLAEDDAKALLTRLMEHWLHNMTEPLPIACKTACVWLTDSGDREKEARQTYEGGYQHQGEVGSSPALARLWPDFDALVSDTRVSGTLISDALVSEARVPGSRFDELSRALYEPMIQQCGKQTVAEDNA